MTKILDPYSSGTNCKEKGGNVLEFLENILKIAPRWLPGRYPQSQE